MPCLPLLLPFVYGAPACCGDTLCDTYDCKCAQTAVAQQSAWFSNEALDNAVGLVQIRVNCSVLEASLPDIAAPLDGSL